MRATLFQPQGATRTLVPNQPLTGALPRNGTDWFWLRAKHWFDELELHAQAAYSIHTRLA